MSFLRLRKRSNASVIKLRWYSKPDDSETRVQAQSYAEALQIFTIIKTAATRKP